MRKRLCALVIVVVTAVQGVVALQRFQQPSKNYPAGTEVFNIPPSSNRKYVGLKAALTREAWPGQSTVAVAVSIADTQIILPVGHGDRFPSSGFPARLNVRVGRTVEVMRLVGRALDVLLVERGVSGTPILTWDVGAEVNLLDLVRVQFERTLDGGATWQSTGAASFAGGIARNPDGSEIAASSVEFGWTNPDGTKVAQDGDTRVVITNRVAYRTALTLEMLETTD